MAEYYFISQLPSLDGISDNSTIPITEQQFLELCESFLGEKLLREVKNLTLVPQKYFDESSFELINKWNKAERDLRFALAFTRAEKMNKLFDLKNIILTSDLLKVSSIAVNMDNPLEAENFLFKYRLAFLETLRPMDVFSADYILYYGLKLKLISKIRQFDFKVGEQAYKNIYDSILCGDRLGALL